MHGLHAAPQSAASPTRRTARPATRRLTTRAIVGGLLIAFAIIGAVLIARHSSATPTHDVVVTAHAIAPGVRIGPSDLAVMKVAAGGILDDRAFTDPTRLDGAIALAPLSAGDVVQRSSVLPGATPEPSWEFSFPVERDRAMNGELRSGEHIDVLATYGTGSDATTIVIARDATLLRTIDVKSSSMGSSSSLSVSVALRSGDEVLDVAHAAQVAHITLVRTTRTLGATSSRTTATGPLSRSTGALR